MLTEAPLDEIQWRSPVLVSMMGGALHTDNILWYFQESPFFDRTSNNQVLVSQATVNPSMATILHTRAAFEGRLRTMAGLEFVVAETPAQQQLDGAGRGGMNMGMGGMGMGYGLGISAGAVDTGVWVIRKQTRGKRGIGDYDDAADDDGEGGDTITVHTEYFVVGENIYMAPALSDIFMSRIDHMIAVIRDAVPGADNARKWTPSEGHQYRLPTATTTATTESKDAQRTRTNTPDPSILPRQTTFASAALATAPRSAALHTTAAPPASLNRLVLDSIQTHMRHGTDYLDQNPITGQPGSFQLATTSRAAAARAAAAQAQAQAALAANKNGAAGGGIGGIGKAGLAIDTKAAAGAGGDEGATGSAGTKKDGAKTPKTPTSGKLKRRKSKISNAGAT